MTKRWSMNMIIAEGKVLPQPDDALSGRHDICQTGKSTMSIHDGILKAYDSWSVGDVIVIMDRGMGREMEINLSTTTTIMF